MNIRFLASAGMAFLAMVAGCGSPSPVAGTMDESNQSVSARLMMPGGTAPAADALIQFWHPDDTTKIPLAEVVTKSDGSYQLPQFPDGMYRLVARKPSAHLVAIQDSLYAIHGVLQVRLDTLILAGIATGHVKVGTIQRFAPISIEVVGTDVVVATDSSGNFTLDNLPSGSYTLRVGTSSFGSTITHVTVRFDSSQTVVLDTIQIQAPKTQR